MGLGQPHNPIVSVGRHRLRRLVLNTTAHGSPTNREASGEVSLTALELSLSLSNSVACGSCTNNGVSLGHDMLRTFQLCFPAAAWSPWLSSSSVFPRALVAGDPSRPGLLCSSGLSLLLAAGPGSSQSPAGPSSMAAAARAHWHWQGACGHHACKARVQGGSGPSRQIAPVFLRAETCTPLEGICHRWHCCHY
jgi:hypothetical protein